MSALIVKGPERAPRVLVVDDEPEVVRALVDQLRREFRVFGAVGSEQAHALLSENDFAVIISDQRMPGLSGVALLTEASHRQPNAVRMLLTGYADIEAIVKGINEAGISTYLSKPWDRAGLLSEVRQAATRYQVAEGQTAVLESMAADAGFQKLADPEEQASSDEEALARLLELVSDGGWLFRRLHRLLPTCMLCSKVRPGREKEWVDLQTVLRSYGVDLSHSYCPHCLEEIEREEGLI